MPFIAPILAGLGAAFSGLGRNQQQQSNFPADLQDRYRYDVLRERQFNPLAPFERARKGQMYAAFARAWGLDKVLGNQYLDYVSDVKNIPGTAGIGGGENLKTPDQLGIPAGERRGGGFNTAGAIFGGLSAAFPAFGGLAKGPSQFSNGLGAGRVPLGLPGQDENFR